MSFRKDFKSLSASQKNRRLRKVCELHNCMQLKVKILKLLKVKLLKVKILKITYVQAHPQTQIRIGKKNIMCVPMLLILIWNHQSRIVIMEKIVMNSHRYKGYKYFITCYSDCDKKLVATR
ncbi:uncharacterized protein LOC113562926 [Ooceraea biroi]|uniref:uncharacterized protein LOC113562906 n=1 Tax=Ooceraea biroi TaxID=2015173 RepID=UPI000F094B36|nr:uncharacterized protein LOC113562906 [Ooceraea biroi]XP_026829522.1 uncharacterized protein LOC113562926 [Ooceraea biroi]